MSKFIFWCIFISFSWLNRYCTIKTQIVALCNLDHLATVLQDKTVYKQETWLSLLKHLADCSQRKLDARQNLRKKFPRTPTELAGKWLVKSRCGTARHANEEDMCAFRRATQEMNGERCMTVREHRNRDRVSWIWKFHDFPGARSRKYPDFSKTFQCFLDSIFYADAFQTKIVVFIFVSWNRKDLQRKNC